MDADRLEPLRRLARRVPFGMALGRRLHVLLDPELREVHRLRRQQGDELLQPWPHTEPDRYPLLFDALAERLAHLPEPRVLSFGCSSGEEVRALRARMPAARITGIDINPRAIAAACKADPDPRSRYFLGHAPDSAERYDAILALAVLRHGDLEAFAPEDCSAVMPFTRFEQAVAVLDRVLEPGGWLAIYNAHFRFTDAALAVGYETAPFRMADQPDPDLLWGTDNRRIHGAPYAPVLFRKRPRTV